MIGSRFADWACWQFALLVAPVCWLPRVRRQADAHLAARLPAVRARLRGWGPGHWARLRTRLGLTVPETPNADTFVLRIRFAAPCRRSAVTAYATTRPDGRAARRPAAHAPHIGEAELDPLLAEVERDVAGAAAQTRREDDWANAEERRAFDAERRARQAVEALTAAVAELDGRAESALTTANRQRQGLAAAHATAARATAAAEESARAAATGRRHALAAQDARATALAALAAHPTYPRGPDVERAEADVARTGAECEQAVEALARLEDQLATASAAVESASKEVAKQENALAAELATVDRLLAGAEAARRAVAALLPELRGPDSALAVLTGALAAARRQGVDEAVARALLKAANHWHLSRAADLPAKAELLKQAEAAVHRAELRAAGVRNRRAALEG